MIQGIRQSRPENNYYVSIDYCSFWGGDLGFLLNSELAQVVVSSHLQELFSCCTGRGIHLLMDEFLDLPTCLPFPHCPTLPSVLWFNVVLKNCSYIKLHLTRSAWLHYIIYYNHPFSDAALSLSGSWRSWSLSHCVL